MVGGIAMQCPFCAEGIRLFDRHFSQTSVNSYNKPTGHHVCCYGLLMVASA